MSTFYIDLLEMPGTVAPAVSPAGHGRIYFDSATNQFLHSDNGAAYVPFATFPTFNGANRVLGINAANTGVEWKSSLLASIGTTGVVSADIVQPVNTTGSPRALRVTGGAHTTLTASVEAPDVEFLLARTVQFSTGALTAQRAVKVTAPTYAFVAASTISDAATVGISGAPVAGTNATITRSFALWVETGAIGMGAAAARTGDFRNKHNWAMFGRDSTDTNDRNLLSWGVVANVLILGDGNADSRIMGSNNILMILGASVRLSIGATVADFNDGINANYALRANGQNMIGFNVNGAIRNLDIFGNGGSGMSIMNRGIFILDATAAPNSNPAGGFFHWGSGGVPAWRTAAGNIMIASFISAAAATAGAGAATPATVREFLTVTYNGTVCKIALYDN